MNLNILLILLSPYTAFIPLLKGLIKGINKPNKISLNPLNIGLLFLFSWGILSSIENKNLLSFIFSFAFLGYFVLSVWSENNAFSETNISVILEKVWLFSLVSAGIGIIEKICSLFLDMNGFVRLFWNPTYYLGNGVYRILSTFGNPNIAGDWFAGMVLIGLFLFEKKHHTIKYMLGNLLFAISLFLTGSKGAFLGFFAALILIGILKKSRRTWIGIGLIVTTVTFLLIMFPGIYDTFNSRNLIWEKCLHLFQGKPLLGLSLMGIYPVIGEVHGHNIWISIMTSMGLIGLIVFVGMQLYVFLKGVELVRQKIKLSYGLLGVQVLLTVHGIFDFTLFLPQVGMLYYGTASFISSLALENEDDSMAMGGVTTINK